MKTVNIILLIALVVVLPIFAPAQSLFVANAGDDTIEEFAYVAGTLSTNGTIFADSDSGLNGPQGLAFDSSGNLFVANSLNSTIEEFAFSGGTLNNNGTVFADSSSGLNAPFGLA